MKRFLKSSAFLSALSMAAAVPVLAQPAAPMPDMTMQTKQVATPAENAMSAMDKMLRDMAAVPMTDDADRDFAGMMIPHHQGAIDMANYELAHGKDPEMLKLARDVVAAQEREIAGMRAWLAGHPARK
jgi:uncharacterized protein (DUF305 family)